MVRTGRGVSPPRVPLVGPAAAVAGGRLPGATLAAAGGLAFWFSGGKITRGPALLSLGSTGVSSRDTSFSVLPLPAMRSWISLPEASLPDCAGAMVLIGPLSALMIGGSPLRGDPTKVR